MPGYSRGRREQGRLQNVANQLAQLTVGWQIVNEGALFRDASEQGVLTLDLVGNRAQLNGQAVRSGMLSYARDWLSGELMRLHRNRDWIRAASVDIHYDVRRIPEGNQQPPSSGHWRAILDLSARARVIADTGDAEASSNSAQPVVDDGVYRPIGALWSEVLDRIDDARARVDWHSRDISPARHQECLAEVALFELMFRFLQLAGRQPAGVQPLLEHDPTPTQILDATHLLDRAISRYELAATETSHDPTLLAMNRQAAETTRELKAFVGKIPSRLRGDHPS